MAKYYEEFKFLIVATTLSGLYFPSIEKIYSSKWYIKLLKCLAVFPTVSLSIFLIFAVKYFFWDEASLLNKIYGFVQLVYSFFSTFIILSFYFRRTEIIKAFELWDTLFKEELYPEDRQELIKGNKKTTNNWLKIFGSMTILSTLGYSIATFFNPKKRLDHPSGIPYRNLSPDYELVTTLEMFMTVFGFATLIAYDTITMALISLEEAQFVHLKNTLGRIIGLISITDSGDIVISDSGNPKGTQRIPLDFSNTYKTEAFFSEIEDKIRIWISHHHQVLRFHEEIQKIYKVSFAVKFFVFVIIICFCSFLIVVGHFSLKDSILTVAFNCNNYALFYANIRFADSIQQTGENMFEEAFGKSWHLYPKKLKSTFQILLLRSNLRVKYTAFRIYPLSSTSFLKILSSAYSFFTFLLHISRKRY